MGNFKRMLMLTGNDAIAKRAGNLDSSAKDLFEDEKRATEKLIREIESKIFDMEDLSVRTTESLIVGENVNLQKWVKNRINLELQKEDLKFELDVMIARGRGYVPNAENKERFDDVDYIAIDSLYSPVKKVNYTVEKTRVGQKMDYDKLILEIETNGTTSAREILSLSAKIVQDHLSLFVDLCEAMAGMDILISKDNDKQVKVLEMPIEEMDLSVRSYNCLKRANINTVEDLIKKSKNDMLKVRNLGLKSIDEVVNKLESYGLSLRNDED